MNLEKARFNMIEQQIRPWQVSDENVLSAMATTPREIFLDDAYKSLAYADIPVNLGQNQAMLAPREIARMLQALELQGTEKVLEIGTGSGYSAALLSKLCAQVISVDIIAEFVEAAKIRLSQLSIKNCQIDEADAAEGYPVSAPYDAVIITASQNHLSENIAKLLKPNGRVVSILEYKEQFQVTVSHLNESGDWLHQYLFPIKAKPLINAAQKSQFEF